MEQKLAVKVTKECKFGVYLFMDGVEVGGGGIRLILSERKEESAINMSLLHLFNL